MLLFICSAFQFHSKQNLEEIWSISSPDCFFERSQAAFLNKLVSKHFWLALRVNSVQVVELTKRKFKNRLKTKTFQNLPRVRLHLMIFDSCDCEASHGACCDANAAHANSHRPDLKADNDFHPNVEWPALMLA